MRRRVVFRSKFNQSESKKRKIFAPVLFLFLVTFLIFVYVFYSKSIWVGDKFRILVYSSESQDVFALILSKSDSSVRLSKLPQNLSTEAAFNKGVYRITNLWKLGEQEKVGGGDMLTKTFISGLGVPIEGFLYQNITSSSNKYSLIVKVLGTTQTNLNFKDRLKISLVLLRSNNVLTTDSEDQLTTDEENLITSQGENYLSALFSEESELRDTNIVSIKTTKNNSDTFKLKMSNLITRMGLKLALIEGTEKKQESFDRCVVSGGSIKAQILSNVLGCNFEKREGVEPPIISILSSGDLERWF